MLKWAVNQPRPSYLETNPGSKANDSPTATPTPTPLGQRMKVTRRHSMLPAGGKENQLSSTSTPLPAASSSSSSSSSLAHRTPLLRDLSNILSPLQTTTPLVTAPRSRSQQKKTTVYASTLPTFEAEYSPSYRMNESNTLIPGALLALRGMGVPDSYFEKPRYLEQKQIPCSTPSHAPQSADTTNTLSSSQMGDVTLERMIDAILESTRKPPRGARGVGGRGVARGVGRAGGRTEGRAEGVGPMRRQRLHQRPQQRLSSTSGTQTQSPTITYRPAFDPASDLCEYWQSSPVTSTTPTTATAAPSSLDPSVYEEREVRSPVGLGVGSTAGGEQGKRHPLQLRRQRVVRRKRRITTKITSSVMQSAQKLLAAAARSAQKLPAPNPPPCLTQTRSKQRHISPDSGHNSTSDCELEAELDLELRLEVGVGLGLDNEELEASCKLEAIWMHATEARDATKRRLSFSLTDDS